MNSLLALLLLGVFVSPQMKDLRMVRHTEPLPTSVIVRSDMHRPELWIVTAYPGIVYCGGESGKVGCTECGPHVITIDVDQPPREVAITLRHEAMHAVTNCTVTNPAPNYDKNIAEIHRAIYMLSEKMQDFEHDNPDYVRYVTQF